MNKHFNKLCTADRPEHSGEPIRANHDFKPLHACLICTADRNRTDTGASPHDFESCASTNSATAAILI